MNARPTSTIDPAVHTELALAPLRAEHSRATPPSMESLMQPSTPARRSFLRSPGLVALLALTISGAAYGGYRVISRSWTANIHVVGRNVDVVVNGQRVPADQVEWLPDGNCLVTVNGAKILLDPRQPGGATASISVQDSADDKPLIPVEGVPLNPDSN